MYVVNRPTEFEYSKKNYFGDYFVREKHKYLGGGKIYSAVLTFWLKKLFFLVNIIWNLIVRNGFRDFKVFIIVDWFFSSGPLISPFHHNGFVALLEFHERQTTTQPPLRTTARTTETAILSEYPLPSLDYSALECEDYH